jgi:protein-tyrosine phosphatase
MLAAYIVVLILLLLSLNVVVRKPPKLDYIIDNISLGDWGDSVNENNLVSDGIKGVLTLNKELSHTDAEKSTFTKHGILQKRIEIDDSIDVNISQYFDECLEFIKEINGPVLVHCTAGISRSSSVVIAYCMKEKMWSFDEAMVHCKSVRPQVSPNPSFVKQLIAWQKTLPLKSGW